MRISDWSSYVCSSDLGESAHVQRMLAFVVGGAAAVQPVALLDNPPWRETVPPLVVIAADDVAMPVSQHGRQIVALDELGEQNRSEERRVGKDGVRTLRSRWLPDH